MLNHLAISAVFLAVSQVSAPMPGESAQAPAKSTNQTTGKRQGNKRTSAPSLAAPVALKSATPADNGQPIATEDKPQSVKLTEVPAITITDKAQSWKDQISDWGPWIFSFLLVLVGVFQAWLIKRQADLMQAQFDQWIVLVWNARRPRDNSIRITVDLVNRTAFPITFSGELMIGTESRRFDEVFLSPKESTAAVFDMEVANLEDRTWCIPFPASAIFTHSHKITGRPVTRERVGTVRCQHWRSDNRWHAFFTTSVQHL